MPGVELALAALLVAWPKAGGAAALGLLVVFTGVVVRELAVGTDFRCGCFGGVDTRPAARTTVARNVLLALPAAALLFLSESLPLGAVLVGIALGLVFLLVEVGLDTLEMVRAS